MRGADPSVVAAAKEFIDAVDAAEQQTPRDATQELAVRLVSKLMASRFSKVG